MTLLFDGKSAFFAERGGVRAASLGVRLPEGSALFVNGVRLAMGESGEARLPKALLRVGENALSLAVSNRLYPVESLLFDGETVSPVGLSTETLLLRQHARIVALTESLAALSARVEALERAQTAHTLFH